MSTHNNLLPATVILFGAGLLVAATDHQSYLELCVCVVNALSRGMTALGTSILFGTAVLLVDTTGHQGTTVPKVLFALQVVALLLSLFFFTQYVYFLLEIVQ